MIAKSKKKIKQRDGTKIKQRKRRSIEKVQYKYRNIMKISDFLASKSFSAPIILSPANVAALLLKLPFL